MTLITAQMRDLIDADYPPVTFEVDKASIRMWALAVGYDDPIFYDEAAAREQGHPTLPAPPGFFGLPRFGPGGEVNLGPPIRGLNPQLTRSLNGGTAYRYFATVYAGQTLTATTRITDLRERHGKLGDMLLIDRETTFARNGDTAATMRATVINY